MHGTSASVHRLPQPTVMWSEFAHLGSRIERHLCSVARATDARRSMSCAHWYIGTLWVCRTLEGRVEDDIKEITRLVPLSDILKRPVAKPGDCVEPVAGEDVAAVQHAVVVAQKHVARLHRHGDDVLFGDLRGRQGESWGVRAHGRVRRLPQPPKNDSHDLAPPLHLPAIGSPPSTPDQPELTRCREPATTHAVLPPLLTSLMCCSISPGIRPRSPK